MVFGWDVMGFSGGKVLSFIFYINEDSSNSDVIISGVNQHGDAISSFASSNDVWNLPNKMSRTQVFRFRVFINWEAVVLRACSGIDIKFFL